MIITPYLTQANDKPSVFSRRELLVSDDGFAGVVMGEKFYYVAEDGEIILATPPLDYQKLHRTSAYNNKLCFKAVPEAALSSQLLLPPDEDLFDLASMGLDDAVVCLRVKSRSCEQARQLYDRALMLRPRYKWVKNLTFSETSEIFLRIRMLDPFIGLLDARYCIQSFGSDGFFKIFNDLENFTVYDYVDFSYSRSKVIGAREKLSFERYLSKNIFFQNSIYNEVSERFIEKDRLTYIKNNGSPSVFHQWSNELQETLRPWRLKTRGRLKKMAEEVKVRIYASQRISESYDKDYLATSILNLPIFSALVFATDFNDKRRIKQMFNAGARQLGYLLSICDQ